jgi:hypothetical protein
LCSFNDSTISCTSSSCSHDQLHPYLHPDVVLSSSLGEVQFYAAFVYPVMGSRGKAVVVLW